MDRALDLSGHRAVLLGWAGSRPRQLRVLARWYRERGAQPLVFCPDVYRAVREADGWDLEGRRVLEGLASAADAGPIVIHAFSNAGFWTLTGALGRMDEATRGRIAALVIDSAPGFGPHIRPGFYARYSSMAMTPMVLHALGRPPALHHPVIGPALRGFLRLWYHVSHEARRFCEGSLAVVRGAGDWPMLFHYSTADALVEPRYVEAFLATLGRRRVSAKRWTDSAHVRHMIRHPDTYWEVTERFLRDALQGPH